MQSSSKHIVPIELLAPAKNLEVGRVAIDAGADAVYIGGPAFGARKAAGNSLEDIAALCDYAHFFDAKVLVTLNTLLKDEQEMQEAIRLAYAYKNIGVDAIIIQDLRLAKILFDSGDFPCAKQCLTTDSPLSLDGERMPQGEKRVTYLHASTQCDNRTLERVQELEQMGFNRVVLARELSYEEIAHIRAHTSCQLEAFVHGALCVSYSGACYLSESVCGRSANRGECAQMCRLAYDVLDENMHEILHQKHILSLKDLDRSQHLKDLLAAGVTTLKIEGRLKDADYVRNVVAYYRMLLDEMLPLSLDALNGSPEEAIELQRSGVGVCTRTFTPNPEKTFHRGSTDYFGECPPSSLPTSRPVSLVNLDTPKSTGEYLGKAPINPSVLHNGDGLFFIAHNGQNAEQIGFYWPNNRIRIPVGTPVYRNYDAEFHKQLMAKDACRRVLPVSILFEETTDGFAVTISGGGMAVKSLAPSGEGGIGAPAQNPERAEAVIRQQLSKLGGTNLEATGVTIRWSQPYFLTAATLNDIRRRAVDAFLSARQNRYPHASKSDISRALLFAKQSANPISEEHHDEMTCRYCILYELGYCKKEHPKGAPAFLRGSNGLLLKITTHCASCTMTLTRV